MRRVHLFQTFTVVGLVLLLLWSISSREEDRVVTRLPPSKRTTPVAEQEIPSAPAPSPSTHTADGVRIALEASKTSISLAKYMGAEMGEEVQKAFDQIEGIINSKLAEPLEQNAASDPLAMPPPLRPSQVTPVSTPTGNTAET
uniref:SMP domain-containing protein n=1 Tax=Chromera velia CCMP2878 TaxID=1169474 RepID=A0A0G4GBP1_9ALVE|eukprot:Cvel_21175.t1-p1 / transcript=Cvel_21175.t1 / gene=Cvel_21175 / organism=Chromera_velia_CCMP2878 / gene_product=hypothetical protein / transcript_product=hypothetical protein / location=Cvel_scaffold1965:12695-13120(-) / protein_length=142 / sequence_SO=supercontig / SO=protein_coding / is_pseudo=false